MENLVFTQLSITEVKQLFRQELHQYFSEHPALGKQNDSGKEPLSVQEAAELLKLSVATVYALVQKAAIPVSKRGKRLYFSKQELLEWIQQGRKATHAELQQRALDNFQAINKKR